MIPDAPYIRAAETYGMDYAYDYIYGYSEEEDEDDE